MVLLVSGSAFTRRRALRSFAPRSMETANGQPSWGAMHGRLVRFEVAEQRGLFWNG